MNWAVDLTPQRLLPLNGASRAVSSPFGGAGTPLSPDFGPAYLLDLSGQRPQAVAGAAEAGDASDPARAAENGGKADGARKPESECQTCKNRKYQDGSDDAGVSFKSPGHISPESAASVVRAHEQEHVDIAKNEAMQDENKKLVSSAVRMYSAVCPECGRTYIAGGETNTVTRTAARAKASEEDALGRNVDVAA